MSAPSHEPAPSSAENLDQLSQSELLSRREQIDAQLDDLESDISEYLAGLQEKNDPQLAFIEQLEDDGQLLEDDEWSDATLSEARPTYGHMIERGEGILSPELLDLLKKIETLERTEKKILDQLDAKFAPGLMRYATDEALEIISNLDYVAVGKLKKGASPDLPDSDGIRLRYFEQTLPHPDTVVAWLHNIAYDEPENLNYRYAELQVDEIERCKEILERWGVGSKKPWPKAVYDHTELERAEQLNNRYRHYHNERSALAAESEPLLPMHEWAVHPSAEDASKYYTQLASIDIKKELERISITGLEHLPIDMTRGDISEYIESYIPAIALEGVDTIKFRETNEDEKASLVNSKLFDGKGMIAGHHSHDLKENSATIVIHIDAIKKRYDNYIRTLSDDEAVRWTKYEIFNTLAHELGHALHHTLPVSILHTWDEVASNEHADVTNYVSEMNKEEHPLRFMEDFADTFMTYVNEPWELKRVAPQRYDAMQTILTELKSAS